MSRCKRWVFTSFDIENEPVYDSSIHEYLIYGRETCPTTNRQHFQGFVAYKERRTLPTVKRWIPGAHFEKSKGTPSQAAEYCKKDGNFKEYGSIPSTTGRACSFADVIAKAKDGKIEDVEAEHPGIYLRYKKTLESLISCNNVNLAESCGVWICGPPRCGKDFAVRNLKSLYIKALNKWWDGYKNEENVLISDVEPSHGKWLGYFLKIWADIYPFNAEIKGANMLIRPNKIYCTSNFTLEEVFEGNILSAITARFNVYDFFGPDVVISKRQVSEAPRRVLAVLQEHEKVPVAPQEVSEASAVSSSTSTSCEPPPACTSTSTE